MGIPILVPTKVQEIFPVSFSVTKIHEESHFHINTHTITITNNSVFYTGFFLVTALLAKLPKTSTVGSPQVPFLMCTLGIPQKLQHKFFALNFCYFHF